MSLSTPAKFDKAFLNAGENDGLEIWRVEVYFSFYTFQNVYYGLKFPILQFRNILENEVATCSEEKLRHFLRRRLLSCFEGIVFVELQYLCSVPAGWAVIQIA